MIFRLVYGSFFPVFTLLVAYNSLFFFQRSFVRLSPCLRPPPIPTRWLPSIGILHNFRCYFFPARSPFSFLWFFYEEFELVDFESALNCTFFLPVKTPFFVPLFGQ